MMGPPLSISMDFIAGGMAEMIGGVASAVILVGFAWWAPIVLGGAWLATHWLLRESAVWWDRNTPEVRAAQRDADYAFRLAVDPLPLVLDKVAAVLAKDAGVSSLQTGSNQAEVLDRQRRVLRERGDVR